MMYISFLKRIKLYVVLLLSYVVFFSVWYANYLRISAPTTIYQWCFQPYTIYLDTDSTTKSVDVKLFLTWYFGIKTPFLSLIDARDSTWYASFLPWIFHVTTLQTWVATSWTYNSRTYHYINTYQLGWFSGIQWYNLPVVTLYLKANFFSTWHLDFYFINWRNGDDSNVSSGINEWIISWSYTQYVDALTWVQNLEQAFVSSYACSSRPYIDEAYYRQTWYISTSTGVQAVWTSVVAWPLYSWTSNRTLWTKHPVYLWLTWISDAYVWSGGLVYNNLSTWIQVNHVNAFADPYISLLTPYTWWYHQYYEILITGNVSTGFIGFENIIGNSWSTYITWWNPYQETFFIDVFWIDTVSPVNTWYFTWYISNTWIWYTEYTLSWSNFLWHISNPLSWFHASWTNMDDQYKIIWFSGSNSITQNCLDLWYPCTSTGYMEYLNTTWYVRSGNNVFKLVHTIIFTTSFSGYIIVIDRAGNTWSWYVDINMDENIEVLYGLIAYPQSNIQRNQIIQRSGMLLKLAIYSWWFDKDRLLWTWNIQLIWTWWIKTSSTWRAMFTWNFASGTYRTLIEWVNTPSYLLSWVVLSPLWWLIDYASFYQSGLFFGDLYQIVTTLWSKHASYLSDWAHRDGIVNITDLARLVTIRWEFNTMDENPALWVYSWSFFVDIPIYWTWTKIVPKSLLQTDSYTEAYMQYHPYDLDANGLVDSNDYSIALTNYGIVWSTYEWKLNGTSFASMPF